MNRQAEVAEYIRQGYKRPQALFLAGLGPSPAAAFPPQQARQPKSQAPEGKPDPLGHVYQPSRFGRCAFPDCNRQRAAHEGRD